MKQDKHKTKVVFRCYRDDGDCIALFPQNLADYHGYYCDSYMHVGQHGAADTGIVQNQTRLASPKEYKPLAKELRGLGYRLDIRKRCTRYDFNIRRKEAKSFTQERNHVQEQ